MQNDFMQIVKKINILVKLYENNGSKTIIIKAKTSNLIAKMREYF